MAVNQISGSLESDPYNRLQGNEAMPKRSVEVIDGETFGRRLARLRKEAGYSQRALAEEIGISYRMVAYYEAQTTHPPANLLPTIADALGLTVDQLLGHRSIRAKKAPTNERLLRQLRQVEKLPPHARRSVLEHIDGLVTKYGSRG
ncbi:MAG TPA: helix-turn-helix transcriptional regulator [Thermoanaerobaculia bacterium]